MRRLDRGKLWQLGLLIFFLRFLAVSADKLYSLNTSSSLGKDDTLVSPSGHFMLGIFLIGKQDESNYYLSIRYTFPGDAAVHVWVPNRNNSLKFSGSYLNLDANGTLKLVDQDGYTRWSSNTSNPGIENAQLLDTGNLVLVDKNGQHQWESFTDIPSLTDTLLPGQFFRKSFNQNLTSWSAKNDPASGNYTFGWGTRAVYTTNESIKSNLSILQLACKTCNSPTQGVYVPALDVINPHIVSNAEYVYFHPTLGGLFIPSPNTTSSPLPNSSTVILSDFQQQSSNTLKRLTLDRDGGLRIWQWIIGTSSNWEPVANWVVSERGSQCFAEKTCGAFGLCKMTNEGPLDLVQCTCPEGFEPKDKSDALKGCLRINPLINDRLCPEDAIMKEHLGVDMPWEGDFEYLNGSASINCSDHCYQNCTCFGAVYSDDEHRCWFKTGTELYNLGYPTVALHGTNRTTYIKISNKLRKSQSSAKNRVKLGVILGAVFGAAFCVCVGVFCVYKFRNSLCGVGGVCTKKTSHSEPTLQYPGPDVEPRRPETLALPH